MTYPIFDGSHSKGLIMHQIFFKDDVYLDVNMYRIYHMHHCKLPRLLLHYSPLACSVSQSATFTDFLQTSVKSI